MKELRELIMLMQKLKDLGGYEVHLNKEGDRLMVFRDGNILFSLAAEDVPRDWHFVNRWVYHTWLSEKLKERLTNKCK